MATKRISALAAASAAALTDQLAIEDGTNATKKLTLTQVFALMAQSSWTWGQAQAFSGAVTMATTLGVTGAVALGSTLGVGGLATLGSLGVTGDAAVGGNTALTGTLGVGGNLAVNTNKFNVTAASGNTAIGGTLGVTGASTLTGAATLGSTLGVTGLATLTGGLVAVAAPIQATTYGIGTRTTLANTATVRVAGVGGEVVASPSGSSTSEFVGVNGRAEVASGNAQNLTSTAALIGLRGSAVHAGSGVVTSAAAIRGDAISNTGGGTLTNAYGLYLADQTAAANNYGVYQVGAAVTNYLAGKLGIGVTSPDASVIADFRSAGTQMAIGSAAKHGYMGANNSVGIYSTWRATYDGTSWVARGTGASIYVAASSAHRWYVDSGLTDGVAFTPTQLMDLAANTTNMATFWVAAAPNLTGSGSYTIGAQPIINATSSTRMAASFAAVANPSASSTATYAGVSAIAATDAANAQNITAATGLRGGAFQVRHQGTGTVTGAIGVYINSPTVDNQGTGGAITNAYAVYINSQTVTGVTNPYGIWQAGGLTKNAFFGPVGVGAAPSGTYNMEVTGTSHVSGIASFGAPPKLPSYNLVGLPAAASNPQGLAWCSNHTGGARMVVSDGTNWIDPRTGSVAA